MSTDEDDTDRWRNPKRAQSSDDRALAARRRNAPAHGVPIVVPKSKGDPDVTSPFDMLEREPDDEVRSIVERSRRDSGSPATIEDIAKVFVAINKERSANAQRDRETEVVLAGPHKAHKATRRNLIFAIAAAAASVGAAVKQWAAPPSIEGGDAVRFEQVRHDLERVDRELVEIRRALGLGARFDLAPREPR